MTERDLRRLSKTEMLTIIRDQEAEILQLRAESAKLEGELAARQLRAEECGSIAEAALQLNGVFQAAQQAADQYLVSIHSRESKINERIYEMEREAEQRIQERLRSAEEQCRAMDMQARRQAAAYWEQLRLLLDQYYQSHRGLAAMLSMDHINVTIPVPGVYAAAAPAQEAEKGFLYEKAELGTTYARTAGSRAAAQKA